MTATPVIVYYDGFCPLCSREIAHYRDLANGAPVSFVDITAPDFDAVLHGVDLDRARQVLHVQVGDEMHIGMDAVIVMWGAIPAYCWLARFARLPGVHGLANISYRFFACVRPYLQRRVRRKCAANTCRKPAL